MIEPTWTSDCGTVRLWLGDCLEVMASWPDGAVDAVVTDPPYGMHKAAWDMEIPPWFNIRPRVPTVAFSGVRGAFDYPRPDWIGAWVRQGSTQRNGKLRGFNNWEPLLFWDITRLENDVIACPNDGGTTDHPTEKPLPLIVRLVHLLRAQIIADPFMGSGTTGVAAVRLGRKFWGVEIDPEYFETAKRRIKDELRRVAFLEGNLDGKPRQLTMLEETA